MNLAAELAAFDPSPELRAWVEARIAEQADKAAEALRWRDLKIEKLTLELAHLRRMRCGARSEASNGAHQDLFDETLEKLPTWPNRRIYELLPIRISSS